MKLTSITDLDADAGVVDSLFEQASALGRVYDEWLEDDEGGAHEREAGIHASELKCLRKVVLSVINAPKVGNNKKFWRQRFNIGKYIHLMMQDDFARMCASSHHLRIPNIHHITFQDEVRISPKLQAIAKEYNLTSACDGIFECFAEEFSSEPFLRIGLEVKSESPDEFKKLKAPKPDHLEQAHFYMKTLDLPLMWFLYIDRGSLNNTQSMAPYLIKFDPQVWAVVLEKIKTGYDAALDYQHNGVLPPREEGIHCEFCSSRMICKPEMLQNRKHAGRKL